MTERNVLDDHPEACRALIEAAYWQGVWHVVAWLIIFEAASRKR